MVAKPQPEPLVVCGAPDFADNRTDTVTNPTVIVEVLSPSTALKDHNEKLDETIQIDSVQHYVLISQHDPKVEVYTRALLKPPHRPLARV